MKNEKIKVEDKPEVKMPKIKKEKEIKVKVPKIKKEKVVKKIDPSEYLEGGIKVENIVASVKLDLTEVESIYVENGRLKLSEISEKKNEEISYDKSRFPGLVYRIKEPKVAMLIFGSGSVICTGARKEENVYTASEILVKKLNSLGIPLTKKPTVLIQNIVASTMFDHNINLDMLAEYPDMEYEPEQFPGLMYRLSDPKTVMLIFRSGRIVVTGAKSTQAAISAAQKTKDLITEKNAIIEE